VGPLSRNSLPLVNLLKVLASQLIVWHHLAFYGPMSDVVYPHTTGLIDWLYEYARIAVQAFLVIGGFLAARSLAPRMEIAHIPQPLRTIPIMLWRRYLRLLRPYLVALAAAIAGAAIARTLIQHTAVPAAPTLAQLASHVFLLHSIAGHESLSAGVWYVAIDFQLYAMFLMLLWLARGTAALTGGRVRIVTLLLGATLVAVSLFWLNREPSLDIWAPYFFGAYGLGILAQWISSQPHKVRWLAVLALVIASALAVEWRSRILVAGVTALLLAAGTAGSFSPRWAGASWLGALSRISYSVFLIHYAVFLVVGAIVFRLWPLSPAANAAGMTATWLLSLGAGALLHRFVEVPQPSQPGVC